MGKSRPRSPRTNRSLVVSIVRLLAERFGARR